MAFEQAIKHATLLSIVGLRVVEDADFRKCVQADWQTMIQAEDEALQNAKMFNASKSSS